MRGSRLVGMDSMRNVTPPGSTAGREEVQPPRRSARAKASAAARILMLARAATDQLSHHYRVLRAGGRRQIVWTIVKRFVGEDGERESFLRFDGDAPFGGCHNFNSRQRRSELREDQW